MAFSGSANASLVAGRLPSGAAGVVVSIGLVLLGTAILAIAAKIKVPFYPVPMTLQSFAVVAIAAVYGGRLAVLTVIAYLAEGLAGLPVFTNTPPLMAGPAYFLGPTGGFLAGFVVAAGIVGYAADRGWSRSPVRLFSAMVVGEIALMAMGLVWLAAFATMSSGATGIGWSAAFSAGVAPFLLGDALKLLLAALLVSAIAGPRSGA